jgi:RNA polymerase sigma factor (TIGR02999 family)
MGGAPGTPESPGGMPRFQNRAHFFAAAGEAMRRILVDQARRRAAQKRGGGARRVDGWSEVESPGADTPAGSVDLLALNEALLRLEGEDPRMATIVKLRFFAEMTVDETAAALEMSRRTVLREWTAARAWLAAELDGPRTGTEAGETSLGP